jgi:hypothetical protein
LSDGSTAYQIGKVIYYNTNRKKVGDAAPVNYSCETEFKTENKINNSQQNREKIALQNQNTVKEIQKSLNLPESGTLDVQSIEKLIGFLSNEEQPKVQSVQDLVPNAKIQAQDTSKLLQQMGSQQQIKQ